MPYPNQTWYGNGPVIGAGGTGTYNYPNYYSPAQASSMVNTTQQMQPPPQVMVLPGRMVTEEREIVPNEVPNNGNYAFFVQNDLNLIYAKTVGRDGLIHTNYYQRFEPNAGGQPSEVGNEFALIMERLDQLEQSIKKNQYRPHKNNRKPKPQEGESV